MTIDKHIKTLYRMYIDKSKFNIFKLCIETSRQTMIKDEFFQFIKQVL